jgi:hypothetical protein
MARAISSPSPEDPTNTVGLSISFMVSLCANADLAGFGRILISCAVVETAGKVLGSHTLLSL